MYDIASKLNFSFTTDRKRAERALVALDAPGGANIVEISDGTTETDVNLETLFELTRQNPEKVASIFQSNGLGI